MLFVVHNLDKPDSLSVRKENQPAHLEYVKSSGVPIRLAGPLTAEDGETPIGSVLVIDVADKAAAEAFAENDPYTKAGLFQESRVTAWKKTMGWND